MLKRRIEIPYRAKRKDNGDWVYGLPSYDADGNICFIDQYLEAVKNSDSYRIDPKTLSRYTGMWSIESGSIYKGDIVVYNTTKYIVDEMYGCFLLRRVDDDYIDYDDFPQCFFRLESDETEFCGCDHDAAVSLFELSSNEQDFEGALNCRIIGNIWDIPEMMEN